MSMGPEGNWMGRERDGETCGGGVRQWGGRLLKASKCWQKKAEKIRTANTDFPLAPR